MIFQGFKGMTFEAPELIGNGYGQYAKNCKTDKGTLRPYKGLTFVSTPAKTGTKRTIYKWGGSYWFHWITDVDVVRGAVAGDTIERTYYTGDGAPKMTYSPIAVQGGTQYPVASYLLGVPAPGTTCSTAAAGAADPLLPAETRVYVVTYVTGIGEEGPPSPASNEVVVGAGQSVNLTSIPLGPSGNYNITHKRIYRTSGTNAELHYVAQVLVNTTTYSDTVETVGAPIESMNWVPPPSDLFGLCQHPGGFMVGFSGNMVCFSEAHVPSAWPEEFRGATGATIVGGGIFGNSVLVTTTKNPVIFSGTDPAGMFPELIEINAPCVAKRGIVDMGEAIAYPSMDGLWFVGDGVFKNVLLGLVPIEEWRALNPASLTGVFHDGKYFGFYNNGGYGAFAFDPVAMDFRYIDVGAEVTAATASVGDGVLYVVVGGDIKTFDTGAALTQVWKSPRQTVLRVPPSAQVVARAYPVTFKQYGGGILRMTKTVSNSLPFRLASGKQDRTIEFEVSGTNEVVSVQVGDAEALA